MSDNVLKDLYLWWKVERHFFHDVLHLWRKLSDNVGDMPKHASPQTQCNVFLLPPRTLIQNNFKSYCPFTFEQHRSLKQMFLQVWGNNLCVFVSQTITHFCWNYQQLFSTTFCVGGIQWQANLEIIAYYKLCYNSSIERQKYINMMV